ncbi:MAG: hypothetical protein PWP08_1575 [Methanofollis sp.]|nr:hypothetical protein [Methanofollis sp.]
MEIPRGTFSSIRRDILLSTVLAEIRETSFSGYATASCGNDPVSLVFSEGACVLAEYGDLQGSAAWQEIQVLGGEKVEIGMYLLTPQQIRLASEFNKNAAISAVSRPPKSEKRERNHDAAAVRPAVKKMPAADPLRLPRGTFCEFRHNLSIDEALADLQGTDFSGYGLFFGGLDAFTLVFSDGVCILAEYNGEQGAAALKRAKTIGRLSEVSLYALSDQQISLALEFNGGYGLAAAGAGNMTGRRRGVANSSRVEPPSRPASSPSATVRDRGIGRTGESARVSDPVRLDLESLDLIDPAAMAADLKSSYVSILDRLHLGHLVDRKEEKEWK